jgi:hypothetical protein
MTPSKARTLKLQAVKYCIIEGKLYWKDPLGFLLRCITKPETKHVIKEFHKGMCGGHHAWGAITCKILRAGYYWTKLFIDVNASQSLQPLPTFLWKEKFSCTTFGPSQNIGSFSIMGPGIHQRNTPTIKHSK